MKEEEAGEDAPADVEEKRLPKKMLIIVVTKNLRNLFGVYRSAEEI